MAGLGGPILKEGSTKTSKRIGWLNNNAGLAMQIKYSEVKDLLDALGEVATMKLLKEVEEKKDKVRDPTAYLKTAAKRAVGIEGPGGAPPAHAAPAYPTTVYPPGPEAYAQEGYAPPAAYPQPTAPAYGGADGGDTETRLKRRIGWLNNNVQFQDQLIYDKVGPLLASVGDHEAMSILKKLEESAAEVRDPTGWVIGAVRRFQNRQGDQGSAQQAAAEAAQAAAWNAEYAAGQGTAIAAYPNSPVKGVIRTIPQNKSGSVAGSALLTSQLKKRITWLNANVQMKAPIDFDKVAALLGAVGYRQGMEILKHFEEKAPQVNDPTAYIAHAARKAQAQGGAAAAAHLAMPQAMPQPMLPPMPMQMPAQQPVGAMQPPLDAAQAGEKIRKRITWLNANVAFQQPINYEKVVHALTGIDSREAMNVLKKLEEKGESVRDPDGWVITAAKRRATEGADSVMAAAHAVAQQVTHHHVPGLAALPPPQQAYPNAGTDYAIGAAPPSAMVQSYNAPPMQHGGEVAQYPAADAGLVDEKIRKRVGWLNRSGKLTGEIKYDRVGPLLSPLGSHVAMELLKQLEENAATVRDPTGYIVTAAQRRLGQASGASTPAAAPGFGQAPGYSPAPSYTPAPSYNQASAYSPAPAYSAPVGAPPMGGSGAVGGAARPPLDDDQRLRKRIGWMNRNLTLSGELRYDQAAAALQGLPSGKQMEILKGLEENSASIQDPTAYVAQMASEAASAIQNGSAPQSYYEEADLGHPDEPVEEKLRRRIDWMNKHLFLPTPLDFDRLRNELLALDLRSSMDILKKLEGNVSTVRDPYGWVKIACQRVSQQMTGGGAPVQSATPSGTPRDQGDRGDPQERLRKRMTWLNGHVALSSPLDFNALAPRLLELDVSQAMQILKKLEEGASTILDPNTYVAMAADNILVGNSAGVPQQGESGALDDALRKRISWINANVSLAAPLNYEQLQPALLALDDRGKAMEVLKKLETNAYEVADPNEYVSSMANTYLAV